MFREEVLIGGGITVQTSTAVPVYSAILNAVHVLWMLRREWAMWGDSRGCGRTDPPLHERALRHTHRAHTYSLLIWPPLCVTGVLSILAQNGCQPGCAEFHSKVLWDCEKHYINSVSHYFDSIPAVMQGRFGTGSCPAAEIRFVSQKPGSPGEVRVQEWWISSSVAHLLKCQTLTVVCCYSHRHYGICFSVLF